MSTDRPISNIDSNHQCDTMAAAQEVTTHSVSTATRKKKHKSTRVSMLKPIMTAMVHLSQFLGPGYMVAVGYLVRIVHL